MKKQISVIARTVAFQQTCHPTCMFGKLRPLLYSRQAWARRGVTPVPSAPRLVSPQEGQLCPMCPSGAQPWGLCVPPRLGPHHSARSCAPGAAGWALWDASAAAQRAQLPGGRGGVWSPGLPLPLLQCPVRKWGVTLGQVSSHSQF